MFQNIFLRKFTKKVLFAEPKFHLNCSSMPGIIKNFIQVDGSYRTWGCTSINPLSTLKGLMDNKSDVAIWPISSNLLFWINTLLWKMSLISKNVYFNSIWSIKSLIAYWLSLFLSQRHDTYDYSNFSLPTLLIICLNW